MSDSQRSGRSTTARRRNAKPSKPAGPQGRVDTPAEQLGDVADHTDQIRRTLGGRVRALRQRQGLSGKALAERAGISAAMVSQIENGGAVPSLDTLLRIASILRAQVGQLISLPLASARVVRASDREPLEFSELGLRDELISADAARHLEVNLIEVAPGGGSGPDPLVHTSEVEFVFVLAGLVEITLGDERLVLRRGDTVTFDGRTPHGFANTTARPARLLWAATHRPWDIN